MQWRLKAGRHLPVRKQVFNDALVIPVGDILSDNIKSTRPK